MKHGYSLTLRRTLLLFIFLQTCIYAAAQKKILVFSKTSGFRHSSIPNGLNAIRELGNTHGFTVVNSEDAADFTNANLPGYSAVVFMSTTGDVLNNTQQAAFEQYIRSGGGFVGIHAATDTEYDWPWYGRLVGAWFNGHPDIQQATIHINNAGQPGNESLPSPWSRLDEWYNFGTFQSNVTALINIDEGSYTGGTMGTNHPIAWYHDFDGGRSWYTAMGHTEASFDDAQFRNHILGGIRYAIGNAAVNQAPHANAGADKEIILPVNSVELAGSGSDTDGIIKTFLWSKTSGPAGGSIQSSSTAKTEITALQAGTYVFRLTVTDNENEVAFDEVKIQVNSAATIPANQLPKANAGTNISINLPLNTVTLKGTGTDTDGTIASFAWSKISGPVSPPTLIQNPSTSETKINGLIQGSYVFRLTVTDDDGGKATDDILVKVGPPLSASNQSPVANAGEDKTISLQDNQTLLDGSASADPDGSIVAWSWIKLNGPLAGLMTGGNEAKLSLSSLEAGTYLFELTVTDNRGASSSDEVQVVVLSGGPNDLPVIKTEDSVFVRLPVQNVELDASASFDPDGTVKSANWEYVKGPRKPQILGPTNLKTIVAGLIPGTYLFRLTITDDAGASAQKNVFVVVRNSTARRLIPTIGFFPNPAQNKLTMTIDAEIEGRTQVIFFDFAGRPVYSAALIKNSRVLNHQFNISGLSKGVYSVEITIERAEKVVRRIVKQ